MQDHPESMGDALPRQAILLPGPHAFAVRLPISSHCPGAAKAWVTRCQDRRSCFRVRMLSRCGCQYQVIAQEPRKHGTHSTWVACFRGEFARMAFVQDHPESMGDALPRQAILLPGPHAFAVRLPISSHCTGAAKAWHPGCQYQVIAQEPRKHGTPVANIKSLHRSRESMAHRRHPDCLHGKHLRPVLIDGRHLCSGNGERGYLGIKTSPDGQVRPQVAVAFQVDQGIVAGQADDLDPGVEK